VRTLNEIQQMVETYLKNHESTLLSKYTSIIVGGKRPIHGREKSVEMTLTTFERAEKCNALFLSEAGSGKTALANELARMDTKRVYLEVDFARLVVDLKDASDLSGALKQMADEIEDAMKEINISLVLFFDEYHQLAKISELALDGLKPILEKSGSRGIRVICATTYEEFDKYLAENQALTERFQTIKLEQLTTDVIIQILQDFASDYITELPRDLAKYIVDVTDKYFPERSQPRKSKDVVDAMIGKIQYAGKTVSKELVHEVLRDGYDVELDTTVNPFEIAKLLNQRVFDQPNATQIVEDSLQSQFAGFARKDKPKASWLFCGKPAVGKTELAKCVADLMVKGSNNFIRMDMSDYSHPDSVATFKNELTRKVWERPFSVILLDEVEKATRGATLLLLQVLDEGYLTNRFNRRVSFRNAYVILTTNAGSELFNTIGDYFNDGDGDLSKDRSTLLPVLKRALSANGGDEIKFPPELLSRVDAIIPFAPLSLETQKKIASSALDKLAEETKQASNTSIVFMNKDDLVDYITIDLVSKNVETLGGAREVKGIVSSLVQTEIAKAVNRNPNRDTLYVSVENMENSFARNTSILKTLAYLKVS
jgi:ATP-dependent Clp protease ATP-binding subunit ClpC